MEKSPFATLFKQIIDDDLDAVMPTIIENNWFNVRFDRYVPGMNRYSLLSGARPSIVAVAAYFGSVDIFRFLIANQADLNQADEKGVPPLIYAVSGGHIEILQAIELWEGLDTETCESVFRYAAECNQLEMLLYFDTHIKNTNPLTTDKRGMSGLHYASQNGNIEIMKFFIDKGADINLPASGFQDRTPLHCASTQKNASAVEFLLNCSNIDLTKTTTFGETPLHLAASPGFLDNVKLLVQAGIDVNAKDSVTFALFVFILNFFYNRHP
ncbi:serine/threonine-protein phosphatase 6 regulatory ankyrin repeat subunit A-like isoform X1 [Histomonas meleagridis]|uniref:serine/threonine-protein phosphatase 6 regulatory ankyrin repeat subunit A-like isoform X1 n=1 Tax=Histomonas meleagridis TaxID=135588 RepID=UPI00355A589F|nr:serine/threonine-protein phosphatase 6 regulatory ankyrin repeat subunit A-like isoform X1 [Histomonas meleagridis]KAH0798365.1 serine/threonine-protein phosphatase 6 regulatory ankyrin repeat subunit A-like isoform X1 [Histomonas meleagridis]